ncbi:oligosaccharide repeat unit polymerase [Virgibacillus halodenitrificans]|uniref:O-antigen polymerase n=1 Tax=Virgibacillus halodenitrificans TaxID=1482 RepID=UPI001FB3C55A|nr:O-antigen polymerase [Virgibacillus halodenitrificans]MCJ0929717.1 oligosaccharide repeat unit polymerase [Virgibacillus halodenitrificans]
MSITINGVIRTFIFFEITKKELMNMIKKNQLNIILRLFIFLTGIFVTFKVINSLNELPNTYFLIPLIYSILIVLFPSMTKYMFNYIGILALNIGMAIRYLISPLIISYSGIEMSRGIYPFVESYNIAINLMIYEMMAIFLIYQLLYKKFYNINYKRRKDLIGDNNVCGWLFIILCIGVIIIFPEVMSRYSFVLTAEELKSKELQANIISFVPLLIQLGTLVLTMSFINVIYKYYSKNNKFIFVLISIGVVFIISSFIIGTSRFSVVLPLVTGLYMIYILFSKYKKVVTLISSFVVLFIILSTTLLKTSTIYSEAVTLKDFFMQLNSNLQLYFSGVTNVAIAAQTSDIYNSFNLESILSDLFRSIVLLNSFFNGTSSALTDFNIVFYNGGLARDQILPMIGQGYLYFGFLFAPVFSIISLILLMYFDSKIIRIDSVIEKYIYAYVSLKFGLFMMANFTILLSFLTNYYLILLVIFKINSKLFNKQREVKYEHW